MAHSWTRIQRGIITKNYTVKKTKTHPKGAKWSIRPDKCLQFVLNYFETSSDATI